MELVTTATLVAGGKWLAGKAGEELIDKAKERMTGFIGGHVMNYVRHRRLESFVDQLCRALQMEADERYLSVDLNDLLVALNDDELLQETLFEAYRKVSLSASRDIGPRVIALVTAPVLRERRSFTELEESVIAAAESMNDRELSRFVEWMDIVTLEEQYRHLRQLAEERGEEGTKLLLEHAKWLEDRKEGGLNMRRGYDANATDVYSVLGSFAVKLVSAGLLSERIEVGEAKKKPDLREHKLLIRFGCETLYQHARRAVSVT